MRIIAALCCGALVLAGSTAAHATTYSLTILGTLGGSYSSAASINNSGQVAGNASTSAGAARATVWDTAAGYTATGLGTDYSQAFGINGSGQSVGYEETTIGSTTTEHATIWSGNAATNLGSLYGANSVAWGINASGQVAGESDFAGTVVGAHATLWNTTNHTMTDLGTLGGSNSYAVGIDNSGNVVGWSQTASGAFHATVWNTANNTKFDLGTLGGDFSSGFSINSSGQVAGQSYIVGNAAYHATLWNTANNSMTDLGTLGGATSYARSISDSGQVVGTSQIANGTNHATLWDGSSIIDLNEVLDSNYGMTLIIAYAINGAGQIVGQGTLFGQTRGFLLTPDAQVSSTPIPASLPLFVSGLGVLGMLGWHRKRKAKVAV